MCNAVIIECYKDSLYRLMWENDKACTLDEEYIFYFIAKKDKLDDNLFDWKPPQTSPVLNHTSKLLRKGDIITAYKTDPTSSGQHTLQKAKIVKVYNIKTDTTHILKHGFKDYKVEWLEDGIRCFMTHKD